jgi:hypothetical protein
MKCTLCCFLQQLVDFTGFYRFFHRHAQVDRRHVNRRYTHGNRFKTVVKLRENSGDPCRQFVSTGMIDWLAARVRRKSG